MMKTRQVAKIDMREGETIELYVRAGKARYVSTLHGPGSVTLAKTKVTKPEEKKP